MELIMQKGLTEVDIKILKYQCRMGYVLPFFLFVLGSFIGTALISFLLSQINIELATNQVIYILVLFAMLSVFVNYKMNGKYLADIRNGVKEQELKIVQKKELKIDYEAGSGTLYIGQKMKPFNSYSLIIENTRYKVEKDAFENCEENEPVVFNYAPLSKYRLEIEAYK